MKFLCIAVAASAMLLTNMSAASADQLDTIKSAGKIVCGLTVVQPFAYNDSQTREMVGFEVDLCKILAADLKVKMEYKVVSADTRVPELVQGRVDVLDALMSYTKERAKIIDFSNEYIEDGFYFIVHKDSSVTKVEELSDKRISVAKGSLYQVAAERKFPDADVIAFDDGPLAFLAMQQGKVDATVQRSAAAVGLQLRSAAGSPEIRLLDPPLLVQGSGFGVRKGEHRFRDYLNGLLDRLESSGQAQQLWDKWLGKDSDYKLTRNYKVGKPLTE
ncbi:transporter substrate-binding domain-containing protein [Mesorhizobium sp. BR1-1-9]|uniref:transporter substrate-binding domain-containing protein n=1 Tax=Mesorhizobium sp. BR1-1-9 TaxID=2876646 RepID=UPI001CD177A6|nr:transporter substrate-binding domain-containing protein [Mesorhizobium sp. BR1-1-9]MBZ9870408.1 transporter substrate-binding domain-containing protein [Mesorhizobium sp. BR1-1-9]